MFSPTFCILISVRSPSSNTVSLAEDGAGVGVSHKCTFTAASSECKSISSTAPNLKARMLVRGRSHSTSARSIFNSSATCARSGGEKPVANPAPKWWGASKYQMVDNSAKSRREFNASRIKRLSMIRTPPVERNPPALLFAFLDGLCTNRISEGGFKVCPVCRGHGWM